MEGLQGIVFHSRVFEKDKRENTQNLIITILLNLKGMKFHTRNFHTYTHTQAREQENIMLRSAVPSTPLSSAQLLKLQLPLWYFAHSIMVFAKMSASLAMVL